MLSRHAADLFWLGRYMERAEAMARLCEMGARMEMLPNTGEGHADEWRSVLAAAGALGEVEEIDRDSAVTAMVCDRENPSSIFSCLDVARRNARAVRTHLTTQSWEVLNEAWLGLAEIDSIRTLRALNPTLDWIKSRCAEFRGAMHATQLRNQGYDFIQLGMMIERADMTLRLLTVKHYVLLPETDVIGGGRDRHQWTSVLLATSALRAYHWVYRGDYSPENIVDFLLFNESCPRSFAYCHRHIASILAELTARGVGRRIQRQRQRGLGQSQDQSQSQSQGQSQGESNVGDRAQATSREIVRDLASLDVEDLFQDDLQDFLSRAIARNNRVSDEIAAAFHFA